LTSDVYRTVTNLRPDSSRMQQANITNQTTGIRTRLPRQRNRTIHADTPEKTSCWRCGGTMTKPCPFCEKGDLYADDLVSVRYDLYPVADGHMLVTPNRHVSSLLELREDECVRIHQVSLKMIREYDARLSRKPDQRNWNIGVNIGKDAGQTVPHAHVHLIPRTPGDVEDPRGGVRWVVGSKAKYWN